MRRSFLTLAILGLAISNALGDGIILADGRKLNGRVVEKPDGYEVTVEGQTTGFTKEQIKRIVKSPREVLGDADRQVEEAKKLYSEAVVLTDEKAAEAKFRDALPRVQKAREAYVDARELFPEGYPELDEQLVTIMKLMRLVRERFHTQKLEGPAPSPVKVKTSPAPKATAKAAPAAPAIPAPVKAPAPAPASDPAPSPEFPPEPIPGAAPAAVVDTKPKLSLKEALEVLADPARRADAAGRSDAKAAFRSSCDTDTPLADLCMAGWLLLSKTDADWGLLTDVVTVKGAAAPVTYKGTLEKRSEAFNVLVLADRREVRLRTAKDGTYVTVPGGVEFKAAEVKIAARQNSDAFDALQAFFKVIDAAQLEALEDKLTLEGVKYLALKVKELRAKNLSADAPALFVAGVASSMVSKGKGKATPDLETVFKDLGFQKSEYGSVWGSKEGLALDDYRKWLSSGEYGMAVIQFQLDYRSLNEASVRYAAALLHLFRALAQNRDYVKAAAYLEQASPAVTPAARDHFVALAKSIREQAPCNVCGGTHKLNCNICKGKIKINLQCNTCGGSGKINQLRGGTGTCTGCNGQGRFNNVDCPKCKATGSIDCKARGCTKAVPKPTFESFAEAYQCQTCQGRGSLMRHVAFPCADCAGIGIILQARADPNKRFR